MIRYLCLLFIVFPSFVFAQTLVTDESPDAAAEQLIDCEWKQGPVGAEISLGVFPAEYTGTGHRCVIPYASVTQNVGVIDNFIVIPRNAIGPGPQSAGFLSITVAPAARQIVGWE